MRTSEFEYYLIQELITMPNRELAQQIELHIWNDCPHPDGEVVQRYVDALRESDGDQEFMEKAEEILRTTNEARIAKSAHLYPPEVFAADEAQEGIKADLK